MKGPLVTAEQLRSLLDYDPETGYFTVIAPRKRYKIGDVLGGPDTARSAKGYVNFWLVDRLYVAHRLAWLHVHGAWPRDQIDHINHVRDDNRIANLRECTNAENRQNIRPEGYGVSGYLGVYRNTTGYGKPWIAAIMLNQKREYLGLYDTPEEASEVYLMAKQEMHVFATTGVSVLEAAGV